VRVGLGVRAQNRRTCARRASGRIEAFLVCAAGGRGTLYTLPVEQLLNSSLNEFQV